MTETGSTVSKSTLEGLNSSEDILRLDCFVLEYFKAGDILESSWLLKGLGGGARLSYIRED